MISSDVYSMINPALGSIVLWTFVSAYQGKNASACEFPVLFLPLPVCLSKSIRDNFRGSNSQTGLLTWVNRHPEVLVSLADNVEKSASFTRESIIFGLVNKILKIEQDGRIAAVLTGFKRKPMWKESDELNDIMSVSKLFGSWCGQLQSTELIFSYLGISI